MKWLILTVGGSHQPIVRSIRDVKPDRIVFVCSQDSCSQINGSGKVCRSDQQGPADLPNIPAQLRLPADSYEIVTVDNPDDLSHCYDKIFEAIRSIRDRDENAEIRADFTGGTKSMSSMLVSAALDSGGVNICLVTGDRRNLQTVTNGTEALKRARMDSVLLQKVIGRCNSMLSRYDYAAAEGILQRHLAEESDFPEAIGWINFCRAFDAWDRFDHAKALTLLQAATGSYDEHKAFLGLITRVREEVSKSYAGYLLALDLLANAERRAAQGRFDDAIGRHYRAVELVAQTLLWRQHGIDTSRVPIEKLPPDMQNSLAGRKEAKIGLQDAWKLATYLDPELSEWFTVWEGKLMDAVNVRNRSLFAHGTTPITEAQYWEDKEGGMASFVEAALQYIVKKQLVRELHRPPAFPTCLP